MVRKQPFSFEEFKSIYSRVPRLCVDLVIRTDNGILLTLREKNGFLNQWHLPGGTVYFRERLVDAVQRVAQEELGTELIIESQTGHIEYLSEVEERGFGYSVAVVFICKLKSDKLALDDQSTKFDFFKTPPENTIEEQREFLNKLLLIHRVI